MSASSSTKRVPRSAELRVGGFVRLSTCDWPGELVATVFSQGCPWACGYCHNPHLIPPNAQTNIAWSQVMSFLDSRCGLLDSVVFSGGEPTLQAALPEAMRAVRALGFRIGLHSAGPYPERLAAVLPLIDWIGFDVKAAFADYARITGVPGSGDKARQSLRHVLESGVACEIRTTVHTGLLDPQQMADLAADLAAAGVVQHKIQPFRAVHAVTQ